MDTQLLGLLSKYFPGSKLEKEDTKFINGDVNWILDQNGEFFLEIIIDTDYDFNDELSLIIRNIVKTKIYSGKDILKKLEKLCKEIPEIKNIIIESDWSSLNYGILGDSGGFKICLMMLSILYKEETYFTSLGYIDETYYEDKKQWEITRNLKFNDIILSYDDYIKYSDNDFFDDPRSKYYIYRVLKMNDPRGNDHQDEVFFKLAGDFHKLSIETQWNELYPEYIFNTLTLKEIGTIIYNILKDPCDPSEYKLFQLILGYASLILHTSFEGYTKRVNK